MMICSLFLSNRAVSRGLKSVCRGAIRGPKPYNLHGLATDGPPEAPSGEDAPLAPSATL